MKPTEERRHNDLVTLKEYFTDKIEAQKTNFNIQINAIESARVLAHKLLETRLEELNTLKSQSSHFVTQKEMDIQFSQVKEDIRSLRDSRSELKGKADQSSVLWAMAIGGIGAIGSIVAILALLLK